ncbi:M20/M25/M40 family metallo-hydrolase [Pedobacter faecalis]|uniref:M20/M25/M40 family metallo-hydrolase n=1 Tax=Pedobacter faecalis TaxID=3041495 RepID=UPI00254F6A60|nr:M20/M25/M40 family metallo-hydrolase [Pedobacter sp. ELA7]
MKITFFCAFLCTLCFSLSAQDETQTVFRQINSDVLARSQAYRNLEHATAAIGHRLTGSVNGKKAEAYAFKLLESYGYEVRYQPFEVESWSRLTNETRVGDQPGSLNKITSVTLAHSPVSANITAELVDLGNGLEDDYIKDAGRVRGKIALVYLGLLPGSPSGSPSLHRSEKAALATRYGAAGIIIINTVRTGVLLTGTASVTGKLIPIPAVCIGYENGMRLKEALKSHSQYANLNMTNFSGAISARNVIATLKGHELPAEKIVIGAHLDSWDLATGAIDNGIGAFAVIDMARAIKQVGRQPRRTIEFVLFMGEEQGLLGSKAYIQKAVSDQTLHQVRFMLNFDMTNDPKGFVSTRREMEPLLSSWGAQIAKLDTGFKNIVVTAAGLHSDHQPFMLQGIPTGGGAGGRLPNNSAPFYHSDRDTFELVDEHELKNTVRYGAMLAFALAHTDQIPANKLDEAQLASFLRLNELEIPLRIAGEWRWK